MAQNDQQIEARGGDYSSDEMCGDTFSINSDATRYRLENGRQYHAYKDGTYWAPNDDKQNENLDISHHKYLIALDGKLLLAPVEKTIERVLDIGTGTGIWAIDFADEFPDTTIIGTDLSPIQPSLVPPNCRFELDDCRDPWMYPRDFFDLIHIRGLFGSIDDWPALYNQVYEHTKPGGYVEQVEISIDFVSDDGTLAPDSPLHRFTDLFTEAGLVTGRTFRISDTMKSHITNAGFINIHEEVIKTPIGGWPTDPKLRELGRWALLGLDTGLEGYALATLTRVMSWTPEEVHVLLAQIREATRDRRVHCYHKIKVVYGQKPLLPGPTVASALALS